MQLRSWIAIPILAVVTAAGAFAVARDASTTLGAAGVAAAFAAAIRMLAGDSPAALAGAAAAALLAVALVLDQAPTAGLGAWLAIAATGWTIAELARVASTPASPIVAMLPATIAAILEPACTPLVAIAGTRLVTAPWQRPRWAIALPIVGGLAVIVAIIAGGADSGWLGRLGHAWYGAGARPADVVTTLVREGSAIGPLVAVAALAGFAIVMRVHLASLAIAAVAIGALLVAMRAGGATPIALGLAALCAGLGVGRLAGMIRIASGQAIVGATCAALLLVPPAWTVVEAARASQPDRS
ncbi:MAG TPA: hypothetical protein VFQ53_11100 [Kofleriaceae bacterium]|nr:hypothetical protein [Kofleriaceae bacterium]